MHRLVRGLAILACLGAAACGNGNVTPGPVATPTPPPPTPAVASANASEQSGPTPSPVANPDPAGIVWLCRPGIADNPCAGDLTTTIIDPTGEANVDHTQIAANPPVDCFYVYPTTSLQSTTNADLSIDPEEKAVAVSQAALFSQVCNVYAPIYPQLTVSAVGSGAITSDAIQTAYEGVRAAFADYMASYNGGRGVVFVGHSQGAMILTELLRSEVDSNPALRTQLVSALLLGGNVTVPVGATVGDVFANIPACESQVQVGCVVAFSSFDAPPPADAVFGRVAGGLKMFDFVGSAPQQILCVNPASPGGGVGELKPIFRTAAVEKLAGAPSPAPASAYVSYPGQLTAECKSDGGASWLQITRSAQGGPLPVLAGSEGPAWGLHDLDVNLALGNLVGLVATESAAYGH